MEGVIGMKDFTEFFVRWGYIIIPAIYILTVMSIISFQNKILVQIPFRVKKSIREILDNSFIFLTRILVFGVVIYMNLCLETNIDIKSNELISIANNIVIIICGFYVYFLLLCFSRFDRNMTQFLESYYIVTCFLSYFLYSLSIMSGYSYKSAEIYLWGALMIIIWLLYDTLVASRICSEDIAYSYNDTPTGRCDYLLECKQKLVNTILKDILRTDKIQSYAFLLKGEWGSGKTSVIKSLESISAEQIRYIYVSAGYICDANAILNDIEKQLKKVFKKEHFFYGIDQDIHKYFDRLGKLAQTTGYNETANLIALISEDLDILMLKDKIKTLMYRYCTLTDKRIVIVIDDLERSDTHNVKNIFSVLYEALGLPGCILFLLCDYTKLQEMGVEEEYIDKYFSYKYILPKVSYDEIYVNLLDSIKSCGEKETWLDDADEYNNNIEIIIDFIYKVFENYEYEKDGDVKKQENSANEIKKNELEKLKICFEDKTRNYRTIKKMWSWGIRKNINTIINGQECNDKVAISYAAVIEYTLPKLWEYMHEQDNINTYIAANKKEVIAGDRRVYCYLFEALYEKLSDRERQNLNWIIYSDERESLKTKDDFTTIIHDEWFSKQLKTENIKNYIELYAYSFENIAIISEYIFREECYDVSNIEILSAACSKIIGTDKYTLEASKSLKKMYKGAIDSWSNNPKDRGDYYDKRNRIRTIWKDAKQVALDISTSAYESCGEQIKLLATESIYGSSRKNKYKEKCYDKHDLFGLTISLLKDIQNEDSAEYEDFLDIDVNMEICNEQEIELLSKLLDELITLVKPSFENACLTNEYEHCKQSIEYAVSILRVWSFVLEDNPNGNFHDQQLIDDYMRIGIMKVNNPTRYVGLLNKEKDKYSIKEHVQRLNETMALMNDCLRYVDNSEMPDQYIDDLKAIEQLFSYYESFINEGIIDKSIIESYYGIKIKTKILLNSIEEKKLK